MPLGYDDDLFWCGGQSHDDNPFTLGLVGRMVPEKGVLTAVRALAEVRVHRQARLLLVGDGPEIGPARELAAYLGIADDVEIYPWLSTGQLAECYRRMHVLLLPSASTATWVEQFGRVIIEAQASGVVVAGYASGAISEVSADAGWLVQERDAMGLFSAVVSLASNAEAWSGFRSLGLARSRKAVWAVVAEAQSAFYREIASGTDLSATARRSGAAELRSDARAEFGPPARTLISARPVALPVVRDSRHLDKGIGVVADRLSVWKDRLSSRGTF